MKGRAGNSGVPEYPLAIVRNGVTLPCFHVQHVMPRRVGFIFDESAVVDRRVHALS